LIGLSQLEPVGGGCIHRCFRALKEGRPVFLKMNDAPHADGFAAEADGLRALRAAGATAPEPLEQGVSGNEAYLLMEFLELQPGGDSAALGRMLARVHESKGKTFGWTRDNYIGATPQLNEPLSDWKTFWRERRMAPQIALAKQRGFEIDLGRVCDVLDGHEPPPSLVHGDLWSGNAAFLRGGAPAIFDPAVYYGDREVDLAMTELFGGFPQEFYAAYGPLPAGYETRKHLYNLYHLLNHLNLFGSGYFGQVKTTLRLLAGAL
jgi:protein-ribulosamine 3-kinase